MCPWGGILGGLLIFPQVAQKTGFDAESMVELLLAFKAEGLKNFLFIRLQGLFDADCKIVLLPILIFSLLNCMLEL